MDNQQGTIAELAWLAGIIDGEGWIGFTLAKDQRGNVRRSILVKTEIRINNCDKAIVDKCIDIWRKVGVNPYIRNYKHKGIRRRVYELATKNMTGVSKILIAVIPYLVGNKLERAKIMLRFIQSRKRKTKIRIPDEHYSGAGPRNFVSPYTEEEVNMVKSCRKLQATGSSETTRESRNKAVIEFEICNQQYKEMLMSDKI
jgi:hypothetical protein